MLALFTEHMSLIDEKARKLASLHEVIKIAKGLLMVHLRGKSGVLVSIHWIFETENWHFHPPPLKKLQILSIMMKGKLVAFIYVSLLCIVKLFNLDFFITAIISTPSYTSTVGFKFCITFSINQLLGI